MSHFVLDDRFFSGQDGNATPCFLYFFFSGFAKSMRRDLKFFLELSVPKYFEYFKMRRDQLFGPHGFGGDGFPGSKRFFQLLNIHDGDNSAQRLLKPRFGIRRTIGMAPP